MPDFHREDDWWRHGQNLYLDNLEATGLYQVPFVISTTGRCAASAVLVHRCRIMPPFTVVMASCCTYSWNNLAGKREVYRQMAASTPSGVTGHARICLYGDLHRFGRRIDLLRVKTGLKAIPHWPHSSRCFVRNLSDGWYQVRITGRDVSTSGLAAQLHEDSA